MSFTDRKLEFAMFALVAVLVGGLGYLFKTPVQAVLAGQDVVYEMPRPKSFLATLFGLGLEDREISRNYVNPFDKKKKDAAKKAEDAKKTAAAAAKTAQKTAAAKKADDTKKPKVEARVVGNDSQNGLSGSDIAKGANGSVGGALPVAATGAGATSNEDQKDITGDQWRSLLSSQPTKENVNKLLAAYMGGTVDASTFYQIVTDLLKNNKSDTQALGLYAVNYVYSGQSFAVVAVNYDQLTSENQSTAHTYLLGYATAARLAALTSALSSSTAEVVETALQVVISGYQSAKAGSTTVTASDRSRGNSATSSNTVSDYTNTDLVKELKALAKSSDSSIASLASSALNQIQTIVASN